MNSNVYNTEVVVAPQTKQRVVPYQLAISDSECLTTKAKDFEFGDPSIDPIEIAERLVETARQYKIYNIAANQVGLDYNIFVAGAEENWVGFFNPTIVSESSDTSIVQESDITNAGLVLAVKRPNSIMVQYQDFNGETKLVKYEGLTARLVQQSIDRLNGIDFKDRVSKLVLFRAKKALEKHVKRYVRSNIRMK